MPQQRMHHDHKNRIQLTPALYGAELNIREATPDDLPPNCAWIDADNFEDAARLMSQKIVQENALSTIWVPPDTGQYRIARKFFAASAGNLTGEWNVFIHRNENMLDRLHREGSLKNKYRVQKSFLDSGAIKETFYRAAKKQYFDQAEAFIKAFDPKIITQRMGSTGFYNVSPYSYYIHADRDLSRALRIMIAWEGDSAFLYDHSQLTLMPSKSKKSGFYIFRPHIDVINAWNPPTRAVVSFIRGDWNEKIYAPHSARGLIHTSTPARVHSTLDLIF